MKRDLFNKIILNHINHYLSIEQRSGVKLNLIMLRVKTQTSHYISLNPLTEEDSEIMEKLTKKEEYLSFAKKEISYLLFAMELMRLYVERVPKELRPLLNIADKKLLVSYRSYTVDMLKLKHTDIEKYKEMKNIFEDTLKYTELFFEYFEKHIGDK